MKSRTNVTIDRDLLKAARDHNVSLSRLLEAALRKHLADEASRQWLAENRVRIRAYSDYVAEHGVFGETFRDF